MDGLNWPDRGVGVNVILCYQKTLILCDKDINWIIMFDFVIHDLVTKEKYGNTLQYGRDQQPFLR